MSDRLRIIVGGLVGQYPLGGVAWDYFHYVLGLAELGHEVYYHEDTWVWPHDPRKNYPVDDPSYTVDFIRNFFERHAPDLADRWCYVLLHDQHFGMTREAFDEVCRTADVYLNVSGACFLPDNLGPSCKRVFLDTDPGYNQIVLETKPAWSENVDRWADTVRAHDVHLTYAENLHADDCLIPKCGIDWKPTRCVVTLPHWRDLPEPKADAPWTTIMTWGYFKGKLTWQGVDYGQKVPEFEKFEDLPRRTDVPLRMAVAGHQFDPHKIGGLGWDFLDGQPATLTPESYQQFIADSVGEWSVAKNVYVATRSGWFSCRTACYLAAGRPAVVQDTAWSKYLPSGAGCRAFTTMDEATAALAEMQADLPTHRAAAFDFAREHLAPDRVLPPMLDAIQA
ncbi:MAG: glycosyltransferase family 1 protein [Planctomycetota bacterium]